MSNPFDQFDQADGNPFDQFDGPAKPGVGSQVAGFMANVNRGLGIGDEIAAALNPRALMALGQSIVAPQRSGGLKNLRDQMSGSMANQRQIEDGYAAAHPTMAAGARGTGMAATAVIPGGPMLQGTRAMNMARGGVTALTSAAAYTAADRGTGAERLRAASETSRNPVVATLGAGMGAMARTAPRAPRPTDTPAARLTARGVPTTAGQRAGGLARRLEDAAESLPMTGAAIRARKAEGIEGFDTAAINEALAPIGARVDNAGRDALARANQHVNNAYETAVQGVQVVPDAQYQADLAAVLNDHRLPAATRQGVQDIVTEHIDLLPTEPTGRMWKEIDSELGAAFRAADNASGTTPGARSLRRALGRVRDAHDALMARQNPQAAQQLQAADATNAAMERVRAAASNVGTAGREGMFTGADLNRAVATKGGRSGRRAYGQGTALMQGLSDDAQAVLPSTIPDSGTALRLLVAKLAGGVTALGSVGAASGAGLAPLAAGTAVDGLGALLYSRTVQDALRRSALARQTGAPVGLLSAPAAARAARTGGLLATPQAAPRN